VEISWAVKPEERRRSKPCGAGDVVVAWASDELVRLLVVSSFCAVVSLGLQVDEFCDAYCERSEAEVVCASVASEERSAGDSGSPREQWM
jgi:hypothetical protein